MLEYIFFVTFGILLGVSLVALVIVIKDPKKPIDHIQVGSLKLVKNQDGSLGTIFVDFNNPPDYFVQDQVIDLTVDIIEQSYETSVESRKMHAV